MAAAVPALPTEALRFRRARGGGPAGTGARALQDAWPMSRGGGAATWGTVQPLAHPPHPSPRRAFTPQGQLPGSHEGPMAQALVAGADPLRPPLIAGDDLAPFAEPLIVYSKSASFLHMLQVGLGVVRAHACV